jgi:hypothetical protein
MKLTIEIVFEEGIRAKVLVTEVRDCLDQVVDKIVENYIGKPLTLEFGVNGSDTYGAFALKEVG